MERNRSTEVPASWLWLIRAASWIVPKPVRQGWRQRRAGEVRRWWFYLLQLGESVTEARIRLRRAARSPLFALVASSLLLIAVTLTTGFLSGIRTLYAPLPYADAGRLVACYQVHFLSVSLGVQARYIRPWQQDSKTLTGLASYEVRSFRLARPSFADENIAGAAVTPDFFRLLGVEAALGRIFRPQDSPADAPVVMSHKLWRERFGSDPRVAGSPVTLDGRTFRVIGVLPRSFWFKSRELGVWTLLPDLGGAAPAPRLVGAVGRLRPGIAVEAARAELGSIARRTSRFQGGALRVVPLRQYLRPVLDFIFTGLVAGVALALGFASAQFVRSWRKRYGSPGELWRQWAFFFAKSTLLLTGLAALSAEAAARNAMALHSYKFLVSLMADWLVVMGALVIFRWSILDQARRCPVCLRRLGMPVLRGSWSSPLLEPASTELLCDQGHGALSVSEVSTTLGEIRRWVALEDSWRDLLAGGKNSV
jgi:hypothetical protein